MKLVAGNNPRWPVLMVGLSVSVVTMPTAVASPIDSTKPKTVAETQLANVVKKSNKEPVINEPTKSKKPSVAALDESFLLFLAEIEDVDGELLHPVDIKEPNKDKNKLKAKKDEQ